MERRLIDALHELYVVPVSAEDFEAAAQVDGPEDFSRVTYENLKPSTRVMKANHGRYLALKFLWWKFRTEAESYDPWFFRLNIESLELHILTEVAETFPTRVEELTEPNPWLIDLLGSLPRIDYAHNQYAILRGCAALEQFLIDQVDTSKYRERKSDGTLEEITLSKVTNWAVKDSVFTPTDRETLHFIREVRNQTSHNMWLDENYSLEVLIHARDCTEKLIAVLMYRLSESHDSVFNEELADNMGKLESELETLHNEIETELGWFYLEIEHRWINDDTRDEPPSVQ